jgi:hypothetical protein
MSQKPLSFEVGGQMRENVYIIGEQPHPIMWGQCMVIYLINGKNWTIPSLFKIVKGHMYGERGIFNNGIGDQKV